MIVIVADMIGFSTTEENSFTQSDFEHMSETGTTTVETKDGEQEFSISDIGKSVVGTMVGVLTKCINGLPMMIQLVITIFLNAGGIIKSNSTANDIGLFSIQNIIVGKYFVLDPNIFRTVKSNEIDYPLGLGSSIEDTLTNIRASVKMWFVVIRDVAILINLIMLLYIAIRLAIATIASDKARYKELLYNWVFSMIILFSLQYIMATVNWFTEILMSLARSLMRSLENSNNASFENEILISVFGLINKNGGLRVALYSIVYWILLWTEFKFFTMYAKRMLSIFFLVVISPIITVTYAVDKIADKQAQAFNSWLQEYAKNMLVQPLHCYIYLVFMYMANNIAVNAPLVGVIFLTSLTKSEKIIKTLIGITGVSIKQVGDEFSMKGITGKLKGLVPKPGPKPGAS